MGEAGEIATCVGPLMGLVVESNVTSEAVVNGPRPLRFTVTLPSRPRPLLSTAEATAWFETNTTTLPSGFITGSTSTSALLVFVKLSNRAPEPGGNICPNQ